MSNGLKVRNKEIRRVRVADLEDAPWNFRTHPDEQKSAFEGTVAEIGWYGYPDVYETPEGRLRICDGHLRKSWLLEKYGAEAEIEVNVTDFDDAEAKLATATHDSLAAMAEADEQALGELLASLEPATKELQTMLAGLAEATNVMYDFNEAPESIQQNIDDLEAIRSQRQKGNERVADQHDTERYLVIVFPTRTAREHACKRLGLPEDERYVASASVRLSSRLAGVQKPSSHKAANKRHSGDAG